jgi:hypothetical protein
MLTANKSARRHKHKEAGKSDVEVVILRRREHSPQAGERRRAEGEARKEEAKRGRSVRVGRRASRLHHGMAWVSILAMGMGMHAYGVCVCHVWMYVACVSHVWMRFFQAAGLPPTPVPGCPAHVAARKGLVPAP